jgi:DNA-binding NarL/FixJ family response regulator
MQDIRLLIADHNERFANDVKQYLGRMPGIQVVGVCSGGEETVKFIKENHPDAVLLELVLGGIDGSLVLKTFCQMPKSPVFIVCTDFCNEVSIRRAFKYGASSFLCKPVTRQSIYDAIVTSVNSLAHSKVTVEHPLIEPQQTIRSAIAAFLSERGIPRQSAGYTCATWCRWRARTLRCSISSRRFVSQNYSTQYPHPYTRRARHPYGNSARI